MSENDARIKYYNEVGSRIAAEIAKYTPQLFNVKSHESRLPPTAFGSAVLITVEERYFLVTAGHCVHGVNLEYLGVMIGYDFCTIGGVLVCYEPNEEVFSPNNLDIAVFELHTDTTKALKEKYQFLGWDGVGLGHISDQLSNYLIFGYPESKTRKWFPTKEIIPEPLVLRASGTPSESYNHEQIDRNRTFILYADQKNVGRAEDFGIEKLPQLGGISGCGVWAIFDLDTNKPYYKLTGLITGEGRNRMVLYCSRIDHVAQILNQNFRIKFS